MHPVPTPMIAAEAFLLNRSGRILFALIALVALFAATIPPASAAEPKLQLKRGDRISIIGNTLADRMQHHGWLETMIQCRFPAHQLVFRNLGFAGDQVKTRPRSANFGSPDQWLSKTKADVVFCFFGYNEALRGIDALPGFEADLSDMLDGMLGQKYNGVSAPRIVVFSPIAHENLKSPDLPDGTENNKKLEAYTKAMAKVCQAKKVPFIDLFHPTRELYQTASKPLTMNGIHLLEHGNRALAEVIDRELFGPAPNVPEAQLLRLRQAILDRNLYWFSRYRVVDGYNVYGGRSKLSWFNQSNADVMRREMEIFDVMTANRDKSVWAVARGSDLKVVDNNLPSLLEVKTNKPGPLPGGRYPYLDGQEAINKMKVHQGMEVNLFASEKMFPEIVNPVQMSVDADGRLWVSCWPSYPHWNPTQPRQDKLVILPDENRDGVADKCIVFADKLNSVTGFEFWGGGVLVVAPPEIWFLKDTDGDDKADFKLRILQGVSSADTHHTANGLVIGTDGWLYWSRGVFCVTNMETPTKTFRSTTSGVYRFNPRTFEVEFHFPIGPNPHGDVIDQWGYQFVNDGTSGTGCYANIGKGIGNKPWFKKRVRPVAATGILSSSHFPEQFNGNFLICNVIGFLGVLQHQVKYNGADITAHEIEPIVVSSDPNFRPSDLEIGDDGALYIADWHNALIGHMQHNIRDPNRDHSHGRIYRVTYRGRPLLQPAKMKGKPIEDVCSYFFARENSRRYRARVELTGRDTKQIVAQVGKWASRLDPRNDQEDHDEAQALLECLWVFEEHRVPNLDLLKKVFQAREPRVRAAAIRTLGHWAGRVEGWEPTLLAAARDDSALVRAEAIKASVEFKGLTAAEVIFEAANRPMDPELDTVLKYARGQLNIDQLVQEAIKSGKPLSQAAQLYVLRNASVDQLMKLDPTEAVYQAILSRDNARIEQLEYATKGLAKMRKTSELKLLLDLIKEQDAREESGNLASIGGLLVRQSREALQSVRDPLKQLAASAKTPVGRRLGYAGWISADQSGEDAFLAATASPEGLRAVLEAIPLVQNQRARAKLMIQVRPLLFELPKSFPQEATRASGEPGLKVDYFLPHSPNVALQTLEKRKPTASAIARDVSLNTDVIRVRDGFALRFTGAISITRGGKYTFFLTSDDGSRLYIDDTEVINNDGLHGMSEKAGSINLSPGAHPFIVTYFDNGGGDGLSLAWRGPGIRRKTRVPADRFSTVGERTLHDAVITALAAIPGHEKQKFLDLASLIRSGRSRGSAIRVLKGIDRDYWDKKEIRPLVDSLVAYLSQVPARYRTGTEATDAAALARSLATALPEDQARAVTDRLENLDVRVIAIGTVPYRMIYDKNQIFVQAGKPVEFRLSNRDHMPHNLTITLPGAMKEVGLLAEATAQDPDAMERQYVPRSDKILVASRLLQPGESQALSFEVPKKPGVYPLVCTYPGHWRRMYAALYVLANLEEYQRNPKAYLAANPLPIKDELLKFTAQNREWKFEEILSDTKELPPDRSFDAGKHLFEMASCTACHKLNGVGQEFGPDLANLDAKKSNVEHILRSILEPSKEIDPKYQSNTFFLTSGKTISGMIIEETPDTLKVVVDPLRKSMPTVIKKNSIDEQQKSTISLMPQGLLNRFTREEILDLVAYVLARGDKKNKLFNHQDH
jgi:putative heme-binding domain-containing protein